MIEWRPRRDPLAATGVAANGEAAVRLGLAVRRAQPERRGAWRAVAGAGVLVVLGPDLPWVDGSIYLGSDPAAPAMLLPTTRAPSVPVDLLAGALAAHLSGLDPPFAVFPDRQLALSLAGAAPIDLALLSTWLGDAS